METIDNETNGMNGVEFSSSMKQYLNETSKWANFLAIVGFIMIGLILLGALFVVGAGASVFGGASFALIGVLYIGIGALYFFPTYYLFLFARKIKTGLNSSVQSEVDEGFLNLKKMFKFTGILMIIFLSFYALAILIGIIGGVSTFL